MIKGTILVVEDNDLNMKLFKDVLEKHHYEVLQSRRGSEVLPITKEKKPQLILLDIQLPDISGLEVAKQLKNDQEIYHIPIIAVTAFAMKGDEERIKKSGCEGYMSKPISIEYLLQMVENFILK
jgi:two-component system cell cycle response regulator DivK